MGILNTFVRCRILGKGTKGEPVPVLKLVEAKTNIDVFAFLQRVLKHKDKVHRIRVHKNHSTMRITGIDVQAKDTFPVDKFDKGEIKIPRSLDLRDSLDSIIHYKEVMNFEKVKSYLRSGKELVTSPGHKQVKETDKFRESLRALEGNNPKRGFRQQQEPKYNNGRSKHVSEVKVYHRKTIKKGG